MAGAFVQNSDIEKAAVCLKRHNHKYYYSTSPNELQELFSDLPLFYLMNKNFLLTSCILDIAKTEKVCYTIDTIKEVQSNGKVKQKALTEGRAEHKGIRTRSETKGYRVGSKR